MPTTAGGPALANPGGADSGRTASNPLDVLLSDTSPITVLELPRFAEAELIRKGYKQVCQLVPQFADGQLPFNDLRYFATKQRRDQVFAALRLRALRRADRWGALRFFFLRNHVLHYVLVPLAIALVLVLTPHGRFDRDEWSTIVLVLFSLVVFDCGRLVREPAGTDTPFTSGRVRILIVFGAFGIARLTLTDEFGDTEWLRIVILGFICAVWEGTRTFLRSRLVKRDDSREQDDTQVDIQLPPPGAPTINPETRPQKSFFERLTENWNKLNIKVQLAIIAGFFSLASTLLGAMLKLVSSMMNVGTG
jgi:hypothetical protein